MDENENLPAVPAKVDRSAKRAAPMQWKPGESGNPGGKSPRVGPNGETITELCRAKTMELIERAAQIALDPSAEHKDALNAIFGLLDRGWGKPKESVDTHITAGSGVPIIQIVRASDVAQSD